jgi:hypothetical protein
MSRKVLMMSLTIVALTSSAAMAQTRWYVGPQPGYGGYGGYGSYGGYGYGGASTPGSAAGMAMADIVRSQGMYNQMSSAAMINVEDARSKFIDNQRQWTEVYLMKQRALNAEHAQQKEDTRARNARYQEYTASHSDVPSRLPTSELNPSTGQVTWPAALMRDFFVDQRQPIDQMFIARAHTGTTSELSDAIVKGIKNLQDELRKHIRDLGTQEYMDARKFLDRLSLEGRFPTG